MRGSGAKLSINRKLYVLGVVASGIIASWVSFSLIASWEETIVRTQLASAAKTHTGALQREFDRHWGAVAAIASLFTVSDRVTRGYFADFVDSFLGGRSTSDSFHWAPRVTDNERSAFENAGSNNGFPSFQITQLGPNGTLSRAEVNPEYFPNYYTEPLDSKKAIVGFDYSSDGAHREALERARDSGSVITSSRVEFGLEEQLESNYLTFQPVYLKNVTLDTIEDRRKNLRGFVVGAFRLGAIVEAVLTGTSHQGVDFWLLADTKPPDERLLHFHSSRSRTQPITREDAKTHVTTSELQAIIPLDVPGQQWTLHASPAPAFFSYYPVWRAKLVLFAGTLLTACIAAYLINSYRRAGRIEEQDAEKARSQQQLQVRYQHLFSACSDSVLLVEVTDQNQIGDTPATS